MSRHSIRLTTLALAVSLLTPIATGAAPRENAEAIFRAARGYAVRVRTEIATPFAEDSRGAFLGAGFVVDAKRGWIVTNAHVVGRSPSTVHVAFVDGPWLAAHKVYVDSYTDVAVLAIDDPPAGLRQATLECVETPNVGESVGAFGHPLGLLFTGTRGIVSGRTDQIGTDMLQIDATVDHGNSGGPVIRLRDGRVVGIATAGAGGDKADRVNFATPMKDVGRILELLASGRAPNPPHMPFALLENDDGSSTLQVGKTFDAERWPFEPLDRIVAVGGNRGQLETVSDLVTALRGRTGAVRIVVARGDRTQEIVARPEPQPAVIERRALLLDGALIAPANLTDAAALSERPCLAVQSIAPGTAAENLSIGTGNLIESVDGRTFDSLDSLANYLKQRPHDGPVRVMLRRWSPSIHNVFDYLVREFPGDEVEWVGADPLGGIL